MTAKALGIHTSNGLTRILIQLMTDIGKHGYAIALNEESLWLIHHLPLNNSIYTLGLPAISLSANFKNKPGYIEMFVFCG